MTGDHSIGEPIAHSSRGYCSFWSRRLLVFDNKIVITLFCTDDKRTLELRGRVHSYNLHG